MKKVVLVQSVTGSGDIWGYNAMAILLTLENIAILKKLRENFAKMKELNPELSGFVIDNPKLEIELFGENFDNDGSLGSILELSPEEYHDYADISDNECTLETPYIEVRDEFIRITCEAEHEHANIMAEFMFRDIFKKQEA